MNMHRHIFLLAALILFAFPRIIHALLHAHIQEWLYLPAFALGAASPFLSGLFLYIWLGKITDKPIKFATLIYVALNFYINAKPLFIFYIITVCVGLPSSTCE